MDTRVLTQPLRFPNPFFAHGRTETDIQSSIPTTFWAFFGWTEKPGSNGAGACDLLFCFLVVFGLSLLSSPMATMEGTAYRMVIIFDFNLLEVFFFESSNLLRFLVLLFTSVPD